MTDQIIDSTWLSVDEIAARLGVGAGSIYRAIQRGQLRAVQVNDRGDLRVALPWVNQWIDSRSITKTEAIVSNA